MNKAMQLGAALSGAALVVAAGSAYTASETVANSIAGYGTSTVNTGPNVTVVVHNLSADGTKIESTTLTFAATVQGATVKAGFGTTALENCVVGDSPFTSATCTYAAGGYGTSAASAFNVAVTGNITS